MIITNRYDNYRTGANTSETLLTPANVNISNFGKLFERKVDGSVYAQPLVVPNLLIGDQQRTVLFVATMHGSVYAFDAVDSNASNPLWHQHLANSIQLPATDIGWGLGYKDISWEVGILSTPVIDIVRGVLWCVTTSRNQDGTPIHTLWKLQLADGAKLSSADIAVNFPTATFQSKRQVQRAALTLANGRIYIPFAAYGDQRPYHGWILAYDPDSLNAREVFCTTPHIDASRNSGAGIWQAGQGLAVDDAGHLYVMTGNSPFDGANGNYGDCVLKLSPDLQVLDFFTPYNTTILNEVDNDLGSGGILVIPKTHLCAGGGKESILYLLDQNALGGFDPNTDHVVQKIQVGDLSIKETHHIHGAPSFYQGPSGTRLYVWPENDNLKAFSFDGANISSTPISESVVFGPDIDPNTKGPAPGGNLGMPGGFHTVSANSDVAGTGILWANHPYTGDANQAIVPGVLRGFDAYDLTKQIWNSHQNSSRDDFGNFAKFCCPFVYGGHVYQATMGGLQQKQVLPQFTSGSPALINQSDQQLVLAWSSPSRSGSPPQPGRLNVLTSIDGLTWNNSTVFTLQDEETVSPPGLAFDPATNTTFIGWAGPQRLINIRQSISPHLDSWTNKRTTAEGSALGAVLAFGAGLLFVAWVGPDNHLNIASTQDGGGSWLKKRVLEESTTIRPYMAFHDGKLILAWTGTDQQLYFLECTDFATLTFGNKVVVGGTDPTTGVASKLSPAVEFGPGGLPWLCWCNPDGQLNQIVSEEGTTNGFGDKPNYRRGFSDTSAAGPALCFFRGNIFLAWMGSGGSNFVNVSVLNRGSVAIYGLFHQEDGIQGEEKRPGEL